MMHSQNYRETIGAGPERYFPSGGLLTKQLELMPERSTLAIDEPLGRLRFMTIDDLVVLAQKLVDGLNTLGERKHPLSIRRGVNRMEREKKKGEMLKTASKTFFFDERQTKDGKPFLIITESRLKGKDEKPERSSILIFQDDLAAFAEMVTTLAQRMAPSK
jgi:hypothetical protein